MKHWSVDHVHMYMCGFFHVTLNQTFIFTFTCFSHTLYTVSVWRQTSRWQISPLCLIPLSCLSLTLHKKVLEIYFLKLGHLTVHILKEWNFIQDCEECWLSRSLWFFKPLRIKHRWAIKLVCTWICVLLRVPFEMNKQKINLVSSSNQLMSVLVLYFWISHFAPI